MATNSRESRERYNERRRQLKKDPAYMEFLRKQAREYYKKNGRKTSTNNGYLRRQIRYLYGLSVSEYELLIEVQANRCAVCNEPPPEGRKLCIDHNHKTGKVRGLLCLQCNAALGFLKEDPSRMENLILYVKTHLD